MGAILTLDYAGSGVYNPLVVNAPLCSDLKIPTNLLWSSAGTVVFTYACITSRSVAIFCCIMCFVTIAFFDQLWTVVTRQLIPTLTSERLHATSATLAAMWLDPMCTIALQMPLGILRHLRARVCLTALCDVYK